MQITEAMLQAALQKTIDAGLISRRSSPDDDVINREILTAILQAALEAAPSRPEEMNFVVRQDTGPALESRSRQVR